MRKPSVLFWCLLCCLPLYAQTIVKGQLDLDAVEIPDSRIYLSTIKLADFPDVSDETAITYTTIDEKGFFSFAALRLAQKDAIYRIYVNRFEEVLNRVVRTDQLFLFSQNDTIRFVKSEKPFEVYHNTNEADTDWQRLQHYEASLSGFKVRKEDSLSSEYLGKVKDYAKDSLQILMVKLISIKQLDQKQLLDKDIVENPDYYLSLLDELKQSDLNRSDYLFLENKLAFLTTDIAETKFRTSTWINVILGLCLLVLLTVLFAMRKKQKLLPSSVLSNQERTVQGLILQGKSNKEIANELFISLSTVKTHITNIYSKLQVSNRAELLQRNRN